MKKIVASLFLLILSTSIFAEGFKAGTQVQTPSGLRPIENLNVGDTVLSCSFKTTPCVERTITAINSHFSNKAIEIQIGAETLVTEADQTFFSYEKNNWVPASEFFVRDVKEKVQIYNLTIEGTHNYYVTSSNIIAHNFAMAIVAAIPGVGQAVGAAILVGTAIVAINDFDNERNERQRQRDIRAHEEKKQREETERKQREYQAQQANLAQQAQREREKQRQETLDRHYLVERERFKEGDGDLGDLIKSLKYSSEFSRNLYDEYARDLGQRFFDDIEVLREFETRILYNNFEQRGDQKYIPAPQDSDMTGFPDAGLQQTKKKTPNGIGGLRKRWVDKKGKIYEWDYQHGEVEIYSPNGKEHLGAFDHKTGKKIKDGKKDRKVEK